MTIAHPRPRTTTLGALATATLLTVGLAFVPAIPAMAAPLTASVSDAAGLNAALLASAGTASEITLTANITTGAIAVPPTGTVTLQLNGKSLTASAAANAAGVGVPVGASLAIDGAGALIARGGVGAAGIGGSNGGGAGTITILNGTVTATGGNSGAGIGGGGGIVGAGGAAGNILISGGTVTAVGGNYWGAGIGTGFNGLGGEITISGGAVTATGGSGGAGLGGGGGATGATPMIIDITAGLVKANGGSDAAALGGSGREPGARTTVRADAEVYATSNSVNGTAVGAGKDTTNAPFGSFSNEGILRIPTDFLVIPAGNVVTNTGTLQGAGTIVNKGVLVTSGTVKGGGPTGNSGIILNTGVFDRPKSTLPSLTFNRNDGSPSATIMQLFAPSFSAAAADALAGPPLNAVVAAPTRTGHTFRGWFDAPSGGTEWNPDTAIAGTPTVYAQWTVNDYTVTFDSQNGSPVADGSALYNGLVAEPTVPPTRAGYRFGGWATTAVGGTPWLFGADVVTAPTTIYAQWIANIYDITFESHSGSPIADGTAVYNGLVSEPTAAPTRSGHTFNGWFTAATGGSKWNFATDTITGGTALHAQWTATHTVTFDGQNGTTAVDTTADEGAKLDKPTDPILANHSFNGWFTLANNGTEWNFDTDTVTGAATLFAQWTIDSYTVTFDSQEGTIVADGAATYNGLVGEPATPPTRTGYVFDGWFTTATGGTEWNFDTDTVTGTTTLFAHWTIKPVVPVAVTVTFDSRGGSTVAPETVTENTPVTKPTDPTRTGYTFTGWFTVANGTTKWNFNDTVTTSTTLYAKWTKNSTVIAPTVKRVAGDDRFATAIALSKLAYPQTAPIVYVATGSDFPDALAAAPAAAKLGGPLLLTTSDKLSPAVKAEVKRLKPARIVVVGGTAVLSDAVVKELKSLQSNTVRLWGADRFQTANAIIADAFPGTVSESWLVTGTNFPDALSAAAVAGSRKVPVALINGAQTSVDTATKNQFSRLKPTKITIAGGPDAVSSGIEKSLKTGYTVSRLAGADRYSTSLAINANSFSKPKTVYLATGSGFADALAGAAVAGATNGPLYVIPGNCVPGEILTKIAAWESTKIVVIGGTAALDSAVEQLVSCK